MKLNKSQEAELMHVYNTWWNSYLNGEVKTYNSFLADDYHFVGSFDVTAYQLAGKAELRNVTRKIEELVGGLILITDLADAYVVGEPQWVFYSRFRFTSLMQETEHGWRLIYQHFSAPDTKAQEGETLGTEQITKENQELRDAVKRRTVELEHKSRELEIEASLERVRAVAMGMTKPDGLLEICKQLYKELQLLGFNELRNTMIHRFFDDKKYFINYDYSEATGGSISKIPYHGNSLMEKFIRDIRMANDSFSELAIEGVELEEWKSFRKANREYDDARLNDIHALYYYNYSVGETGIGISTYNAISTGKLSVLRRFRNVFDLAYKRYIDITKAEAQARESQIQLALERVRAGSMAMHKSEELADLSQELVKQVQALGVASWFCAFNINDEDPNSSVEWGSNGKGTFPQYRTPREGVFLRYYEAGKSGETFLINEIGEDECPAHYNYLCSLPGVGDQLLQMRDAGIPFPASQIDHVAFFRYGYLIFITYEPAPEAHDIFKRFANVFEQTYTRFLDLKKSESQTKESQIQLALERVRARTMAMQRSEELAEASTLMFEQLKQLGVNTYSTGFNVWDQEYYELVSWLCNPDGSLNPPFRTPIAGDPWHKSQFESWEKGEEFIIKELSGEEMKAHFSYLRKYPLLDEAFIKAIAAGHPMPERQFHHAANFSRGNLMFITLEPCPEVHDVFKRFAKVFDQTYTRFLDLQKAETQTREAQIELSLERIRSQVTAMRESSELLDIVVNMRKEFVDLGHEAHYFWHMRWLPQNYDKAMTSGDGTRIGMVMKLPRHIHGDIPLVADWEASDDPTLIFAMDVEAAVKYVEMMINLGDFEQVDPNAPTLDDIRHIGGLTFIMARTTHGEIGYSLPGIVNHPPAEGIATLARFAGVFDLAYRRFEDLKIREEKNRQTMIELALERVRAKTMGMQRSDELQDAALLLFQQIQELGIPPFSCGFNIWDEERSTATAWMGSVRGLQPPFRTDSSKDIYLPIYEAAQKGESLLVIEQQGKGLETHYQYLASIPVFRDIILPELKQAGFSLPTFQIIHCAFFSQGYLMFITYESCPYAYDIFVRFAKVFEQTYTRFLDLQKAEAQALRAEQDLIEIKVARKKAEEALIELQETQKQLIQSEKMASLGELTAGIAHEIQNPLNFVNNFSEVSTELIYEMMEEVVKGNFEEVKALADDVKQNLVKISHHGKRADGIVKGMLQHSRSSSGQREPTNINALADEYLRLAYHGLRAKDKCFNALLKTAYDETIGNINVIPQDIGRVILNLITNAFYAVNEKKNQTGDGYEPTVSISTQKIGAKVEVTVMDNGNGIPNKILDKIFQPFFTTKPTGQGTGLGLSLSYDIIKAHGGELQVKTKEGEGSEFIIQLPSTAQN